MAEINLMDRYPRSKRPIAERKQRVTPEQIALTRQFGREYFDGDRTQGYGGYHYHPRFWQETVRRFRDHYRLASDASVLDVGCAKGFMLHDFKQLMPDLKIAGLDVSRYALDNAIETVKPFLRLGTCERLPYPDKSFDLVTAINVIHNLDQEGCKRALRELQRVSRRHAFLVVDAYRNEAERRLLMDWVLTCKTHMYVSEWRDLFREVGYTGDYYWFFAE